MGLSELLNNINSVYGVLITFNVSLGIFCILYSLEHFVLGAREKPLKFSRVMFEAAMFTLFAIGIINLSMNL